MISRFYPQISSIHPDDWNCCHDPDVPFLRHEFLACLERSGCVSVESGWQPRHWVLQDQKGRTLAVAPQYIKSHSYGEYVFDWAWADAYHHNGIKYYPKLLGAIPFTPCQSPRLLIDDMHCNGATDVDAVTSEYLKQGDKLMQDENLSSWHVLFPSENYDDSGLLCRTGIQYHWHNKGYGNFDDFLACMTSRKRKNIRKERASIAALGFDFVWQKGSDASDEELRGFYTMYSATYLKRGQRPYLNLEFFRLLQSEMGDSFKILQVKQGKTLVASALFFVGERTLYGRYWGCLDEFRNLHFETCYYRGIDYCIAHKLKLFDAGAQGEHKLVRGFEPVFTRSYHKIAHPDFSNAIARFLEEERAYVEQAYQQALAALPFKKPKSDAV